MCVGSCEMTVGDPHAEPWLETAWRNVPNNGSLRIVRKSCAEEPKKKGPAAPRSFDFASISRMILLVGAI